MAASVVHKSRLLFAPCLRSSPLQYLPGGKKFSVMAGRCLVRNVPSKTFPLSQFPPRMMSSIAEKETRPKLLEDSPSSCMEDPFSEEVQPCLLCKANIPVSYKNPKLLSQFVSPNTGRIYSRHITRLCQMQQDRIASAITMSRKHGFMPVMYRETLFLKDPNLFDVKYTGNADVGEHIKFPGPDSTGEGPTAPVGRKVAAEKPKPRRKEKVKLTKAEKRKNKSR